MRIQSQTNFAAGLIFGIIGIGTACLSLNYEMGTAARMGPGYFPFWLGAILTGLGSVLVLGSIAKLGPRDTLDRFELRTLAIIVAAVVLFGMMIDTAGLVLALLVSVILSSVASREFSKVTAAATAVALAVGCSAVFVFGLGLPLKLWPSF